MNLYDDEDLMIQDGYTRPVGCVTVFGWAMACIVAIVFLLWLAGAF